MTASLRVEPDELFCVLADTPLDCFTLCGTEAGNAIEHWSARVAQRHHDDHAADHPRGYINLPNIACDPLIRDTLDALKFDWKDHDAVSAADTYAAACYCKARQMLGYEPYPDSRGGYSDDQHYDAARDLELTRDN